MSMLQDLRSSRRVDIHHTPASAKTVVSTSIDDSSDPNLPQSRRTHHAWLDRDIEGDGIERRGMGRKQVIYRFELGVKGCLWSADIFHRHLESGQRQGKEEA